MRTCEMCGTSIEHRNGNTKYCKECAEERKRKRDRIASKRKRENFIPEPKYCKTCGISLEGRSRNTEYCSTCYLERRKQYHKDYWKKHGKSQSKSKVCLNCGADISNRPHNSIRCKPCQKEHEAEFKRKVAKKKSTPSAMDKSNFARKYHSSYGRIENDIQTGRVEIKTEDVELAKELGLM